MSRAYPLDCPPHVVGIGVTGSGATRRDPAFTLLRYLDLEYLPPAQRISGAFVGWRIPVGARLLPLHAASSFVAFRDRGRGMPQCMFSRGRLSLREELVLVRGSFTRKLNAQNESWPTTKPTSAHRSGRGCVVCEAAGGGKAVGLLAGEECEPRRGCATPGRIVHG
ncbi:unnamed protein product, partial [Scytosiphon promiscuus]